MNWFRRWLLIVPVVIALSGCLTSDSGGGSTTGSDDSGTSDSTDDGSSSDSGDDSSTSSGGGTTSSGVTISGTLGSLSVSSLGVVKGESSSGTVTDVVAVSPETGNLACKTASVSSDRTFSLPVTGKKPWYFYFLDRAKTGRSMFLGRWLSSTLDTILPANSTGTIELGDVTIDAATATASSSKSHAEILTGLGLDSATAESVGGMDDVSRRYGNPDADGNGQMDCGETNKDFMLDFHIRFDMKIGGNQATIADIVDSFLDEKNATVSYNSTGVYVAYSQNFSSATTGSVTFTNSSVETDEGGAIAAGVTTSSVTSLDPFYSHYGFGPNIKNTSELPSGEIIFSFGGKTLTFSDVRTPTLAQLTAPTGRIFPFVKFIKKDSTCTSDCTLSGVGYKWVKKSSSGWTTPTLTEIDLLVTDSPGFGIRYALDTNSQKMINVKIPKSSLSGTITWGPADTDHFSLTGVSTAEFNALVTTQICHIGLNHDDRLGMRYFQNIQNTSGTCQ